MPTDPRLGDVAADMERILKPLAERAQANTAYRRREVGHYHGRFGHHGRRMVRDGRRYAMLVVSAAIALLVTAVFAVDHKHLDKAAARTAEATPAASLRSVPAPSLGRSLSASTPPIATAASGSIVDAANGSSRQAIYSRSDDDRAPAARPTTSAEPPPAAAPRSRPAAVARRSPRAQRPNAIAASRRPDAATRRRKGSTSRCTPSSSKSRCLYQVLLGADARLRFAYVNAVRDGVPRSVLVGINKEWRRSRKASRKQPRLAIRRYEQLSNALNRERRGIAH
jgi:hypothetical protein